MATDYTSIGYNNLMQKIGSLSDSSGTTTSAYKYDTDYEQGAITATHYKDQSITNAKIVNLTADKIDAGTITTQLFLGGTSIIIDGSAKQIIVNDGTTDRILIGYGSGLF